MSEENNIGKNDHSMFLEHYELHETIGSGSFSVVKRATERKTGAHRAVKIVEKERLKSDRQKARMLNEIQIMRKLHHPNLVTLYEVIETHYHIYLVMEMLTGGELFDRIKQRTLFTEIEAATIILKLVSAVDFLHKHNVLHRDLKPENLVYVDRNPNSELKLIDFGLSKTLTNDDDKANTPCGSQSYAAPEVFERKMYDGHADMWSIGVIMYILLSGITPFEKCFDVPVAGFNDFPEQEWQGVSELAKTLIKNLLQVDPKKRYNTTQVLNDPWLRVFTGPQPQPEVMNSSLESPHRIRNREKNEFNQAVRKSIKLHEDNQENIGNFTGNDLWKKRMKHVMN